MLTKMIWDKARTQKKKQNKLKKGPKIKFISFFFISHMCVCVFTASDRDSEQKEWFFDAN